MNRFFITSSAAILSRSNFYNFNKTILQNTSISKFISTFRIRLRIQCYSSTTTVPVPRKKRSKKTVESTTMEEEKDAFYVVRKGDIVGVYKSLSDCQAQVGSTVCDPAVSVYKGYSFPKEADEYLSSRGLKNAIYTINAADAKEDLFGSLIPCLFQQPASSRDKPSNKPSPPKRSQEVLESTSNLVKMDEHEQSNSVSAEHRIVGSDCFGNNGTGELTATPLKRYVTFIVNRKDGSACKWICNFGCKKEPYTGTYSRIRAHLIGLLPGQKAQGVALCSKVNKNERENMKIEEAEAKRLFGGSSRVPLSAIAKSNTSMIIENQSVVCMPEVTSEVDATVTRFFVANGISFNVAKSPFWYDMVKCINEAPKGYQPPCAKQIKTYLLDSEKDNIDKTLLTFKEQWSVCGVSIVSFGWTNIKHQPLISVMAISGGKTMFITSVSCLENQLTSEFISEILLKAIDYVGACNVVQVITDEDPTCKSAGEIIEARHPHILWSGCMAHCSSLLLKDMIKSTSSALAFANNAYARAKIVVTFVKNHFSTLYQFDTFSELQVFQVKKTRFGSHYVLLERVVRLKNALINMVLSEEWETFGKGSTINAEHEQVKRIVLDDDFWCDAKYILFYTKPLWGMICFCESSKCCIGEIYPRMIEMLESIKVRLADKLEIREVVENLFMERWEMMNHPLHCLAYVLTPYYYSQTWLRGGERKKPHADPYVNNHYLNVVEQLVKNPMERGVIRQQLSEFMSSKGNFARQQAIEDKETMSAITWWDMYGLATNELYNLAVKVLSQTVSTSFCEREWCTYDYIHNVKRNKMNGSRADCLVYVHSNHRLLSQYRSDYEEAYRNWDVYAIDDNLDNDIEAIEDREYCLLHDASCSTFHDQIYDSSSDAQSGKRQRLE